MTSVQKQRLNMSDVGSAVTARTRSRYREFLPPPSLSGRLVCTWTQNIDGIEGEYHHHSVLPDGCVDIVWIGRAAPIVAGPATHRIVVKFPTETSLIGIRFRPGWAASSLGLPVNEMLNRDVPLADICPHHAKRLTDGTFEQQSESARLRDITAALAYRLAVAPDPDPAIRFAVPWLVRHPAGRVRDLARLIGISDRQLQRRFVAAVGYGPKTFQRIMRFQRLLSQSSVTDSARQRLADLACGAGYADQAHMCREFRELADATPQSLLTRVGSTLAVSDLFNTEDCGAD
jgi:AraC-like DNA-binding protein